MTRRGRKRRSGRRQPNGQPHRPPENFVAQAALQPHRKATVEQFPNELNNQKLGTELGRLSIEGFITQEEYDACDKYRKIVSANRRAIMAPAPFARSSAGNMVAAGGGVVSLYEPEKEEEQHLQARRAYANVTEWLSTLEPQCLLALDDIVIHDVERYYARGGIYWFKDAAKALAVYFARYGGRR